MVVRGLSNGTSYTFAVAGWWRDGRPTPLSNTLPVTPRPTGEAKIVTLKPPAVAKKPNPKRKADDAISFGSFQGITFGHYAAKIVFPDGQELIYDDLRPVDWKARDGTHLLYPLAFGNGLDIGRFDDRGLPVVVTPDGERREGETRGPDAGVQAGTKHPYLTDPITLVRSERRTTPSRDRSRPKSTATGSRCTIGSRWRPWLPLVELRAGVGNLVADQRDRHGHQSTMAWRGWWRWRCSRLKGRLPGDAQQWFRTRRIAARAW